MFTETSSIIKLMFKVSFSEVLLFLGALSPSKLSDAIQSSLKCGADGVCLFNDGYLTEDHIKVIRSF